ncbi:bifunctional hydroxymethylpyrimidine kinase/phosphomethylpyrimidine kinase [candidate division KSB1 bacterium]|nr:bifunctional hydroxymethylpyrimidine kinase/phosphomethylpyrimidine kinase [candidate division KSB1 bacterium]
MKKALTIAGSDSGGGAGIQADLKTFMAFGVYGMSAITALTAQNTIGVQGVYEVSPDFIRKQIKSIMSDIGTDAAKTGMLANSEIVVAVADAIREFSIPNVVIDPVMVAKGGDPLLAEAARVTIREKLIPLATVVTPNLYEAEVLLNRKITTLDEMKQAAMDLRETGCRWIVVKGGHLAGEPDAVDVVYDGQDFTLLRSERFNTKNTHGTGCTFSSAIAAGLAKGYMPLNAIKSAKQYISAAIRENVPLGHGHGPTNHFVGTSTTW